MTRADRERLIEKYSKGGAEVLGALEGFPKERLTAKPFAGKWSAAEIVHHLADSESNSAIRIRKLLAEKNPVIQGYDQEHYAVAMAYQERDIQPSMDLFQAVRASTTQLIRRMNDEDWARAGWHSESGLYTAERWLEIYADHAHGHADQIRRLKQALS
jgi:hypothetical protein